MKITSMTRKMRNSIESRLLNEKIILILFKFYKNGNRHKLNDVSIFIDLVDPSLLSDLSFSIDCHSVHSPVNIKFYLPHADCDAKKISFLMHKIFYCF